MCTCCIPACCDLVQALSCGVVERVLSWARVKGQDKLAQKQKGSKQNKLRVGGRGCGSSLIYYVYTNNSSSCVLFSGTVCSTVLWMS